MAVQQRVFIPIKSEAEYKQVYFRFLNVDCRIKNARTRHRQFADDAVLLAQYEAGKELGNRSLSGKERQVSNVISKAINSITIGTHPAAGCNPLLVEGSLFSHLAELAFFTQSVEAAKKAGDLLQKYAETIGQDMKGTIGLFLLGSIGLAAKSHKSADRAFTTIQIFGDERVISLFKRTFEDFPLMYTTQYLLEEFASLIEKDWAKAVLKVEPAIREWLTLCLNDSKSK